VVARRRRQRCDNPVLEAAHLFTLLVRAQRPDTLTPPASARPRILRPLELDGEPGSRVAIPSVLRALTPNVRYIASAERYHPSMPPSVRRNPFALQYGARRERSTRYTSVDFIDAAFYVVVATGSTRMRPSAERIA
jgi:hypothetical protein